MKESKNRYRSNPFKDNELVLIRRRKLMQLNEKEKDEYDYEMAKVKGSNEIMEKFKREQGKVTNQETNRAERVDKVIPKSPQNVNNLVLPAIRTKLSPQMRKKIADYDITSNANFTLKKIDKNNIDYHLVNKQLDQSINKYNNHLEKLKIDDFLTRKKLQDELLNKINFKMEKIKLGLNDKTYFQDNIYTNWYRELKFNN
jgi:hypothetical protein